MFRATEVFMDTLVAIDIVEAGDERQSSEAAARAFGWFREVEARCSRFDAASELMQLSGTVGQPVVVSPLLYQALEFALTVAAASSGAFDPTVGAAMQSAGFDRNYLTGLRVARGAGGVEAASYRDVRLEPRSRRVTLLRPLTLDLGAVAKGLAVDLAGRELQNFEGFAVNAGGDILTAGTNASGEPWRIGIRDPRDPMKLIDAVRISGGAVCTSGDYERHQADGFGHHVLDPKTGRSSAEVVSVTAIAASAMVADALGTAAFVLGPQAGIAFLDSHGVDGMIVDASMGIHTTGRFARHRK